MAWAKRQYSKGQIDKAGQILVAANPAADQLDQAFTVINNWRACHAYPLQTIKMTLLSRAKAIDSAALIAQRLKRLPSIALKLRDNPAMKLSQMQDIGGCRAVMSTISDVRKLTALYEKINVKNPRSGRPVQHEKYDYIGFPKPDGYRGYHLVFRYQSNYEDKKAFEGQRIEIQIRSKLQHAWATAVETVQTFTGQALKSKIKAGEHEWLRFFSLMGSAIALRESTPLVPGCPENKDDLVSEIRDLSGQLNVEDMLMGWGVAVHNILTGPAHGAAAFLLELDTSNKTLQTTAFKSDELQKASDEYLRIEKQTEGRPEIQAVLVSVESLEALKAAYPNYYLDTGAFIGAMKYAVGESEKKSRTVEGPMI
jgi:ppGpp synthetase/RelA/SpoT-type nucleotidyltranferase